MVTYDWRRCPYPTLNPLTDRPGDTGLPHDSYGTGPLSDQAPVSNYGPLTSDLGPRFPDWGFDISKLDPSSTSGLLGGVGGINTGCLLLAAAAYMLAKA